MVTSVFLVIYRILSWHEWKRAGLLYSNLTRYTVLAFLLQICVLVQQKTNWSAYYSAKASSFVISKLVWQGYILLPCLHCYPLKMADFYCTCVVPHLVDKLYNNKLHEQPTYKISLLHNMLRDLHNSNILSQHYKYSTLCYKYFAILQDLDSAWAYV